MKNTLLVIILLLANTIAYGQASREIVKDTSKSANKVQQKNTILQQKGVLVAPARVFFEYSRGESGNKIIKLLNNTEDTVQLKLYFSDWLRDTVGGHHYYQSGEISRSCARWMSLDKTFMEILPGELQTVNVRIEVPDSQEATNEMKWTMLMIETIKEKKIPTKDENLQFKTNTRIGVHIYQTPPSLTNAEIKILNFSAEPGSDTSYRVVCQNVGNVMYEARSYMELTPLTEQGEKITLKANVFPMFPDQKRFVNFPIPLSTPKGKYSVVAIVEAGADAPLEAAQAIIEVK